MAMGCDDFQIAVLMDQTEYKKKKPSISNKMPFKILSLLYINYISLVVSVACNTHQLKECISC